MANFKIRKASQKDFKNAVKWAENEDWNPGYDDLKAFHQSDPNGFLVGTLNEKVIASISVVRYDQTFGFLGFYITHPDYRGKGYGLKLWNKGIEYLRGATIGLDGVLEQQENYIASGFEFFGRNIRYSGIPKFLKNQSGDFATSPINEIDHDWIERLDRICFGCDRQNFLNKWLGSQDQTRQSLAVFKNSKPCGFGTIRKCKSGYKIGPLFSTDFDAADTLFRALCALTPADSEITLDIPECNPRAIELAESSGLKPIFETTRMYRGTPPPIDWQKVFGITSFELG